ncbi:RDD family protein [Nafulsella turpanensis]|uniref:RDD family protein n=1 Tax=Nafulsella turpanensis TaxID=1265690 RepID=UPI00034A5BD9|nr:RDD family protein [Nafulsella turpanensis]
MQTTFAPPVPMETAHYGGFWIRFVAILIDGFILGIAQLILIAPVMAALGFASFSAESLNPEDGAAAFAAIFGAMGIIQVVSLVIGWLYFALMQSSKYQATLGKMVLGLKVVDQEGARLSFGKATLRYIGKFISSAVLMIGYLIAAFNPRKQALHDMIASTYVIKK